MTRHKRASAAASNSAPQKTKGTSRSTPAPAGGEHRSVTKSGPAPRRTDDAGGDGYDANAGPLDTGYAGEDISLVEVHEHAELNEPGLSVHPEDLGEHLLRDAVQQTGEQMDEADQDQSRISMQIEGDPEGTDPFTEPVPAVLETPGEQLQEFPDRERERARRERRRRRNPDEVAEPAGVDLTQGVLREGSLFDQPSEDGRTRHPLIVANEVDATLEHNERAHRASKLIESEKTGRSQSASNTEDEDVFDDELDDAADLADELDEDEE